MANLMKIVAELSNERFFAARPRQKKPIVGQLFQRAKEAQPLDELADKRIHWDQSFGFQLAEGHMNGPLIWACAAEAVRCEIGALADAHASVADQQENIPTQVVAAEELLL